MKSVAPVTGGPQPWQYRLTMLVVFPVSCRAALFDHIAFASDRDGNYEIYVMDADGSNPVRLTNNPAVDWFPAWSPGSQQR